MWVLVGAVSPPPPGAASIRIPRPVSCPRWERLRLGTTRLRRLDAPGRAHLAGQGGFRHVQPRGCGEHAHYGLSYAALDGPPPRVRGAPPVGAGRGGVGRTTPARAGSTVNVFSDEVTPWDHPRACGEHTAAACPSIPGTGPPPRVRGARLGPGSVLLGVRTTPARAGSTLPDQRRYSRNGVFSITSSLPVRLTCPPVDNSRRPTASPAYGPANDQGEAAVEQAEWWAWWGVLVALVQVAGEVAGSSGGCAAAKASGVCRAASLFLAPLPTVPHSTTFCRGGVGRWRGTWLSWAALRARRGVRRSSRTSIRARS